MAKPDNTIYVEQIKILNLNCPNCGGLLEIHGDMDRFACGYCGSAQIVERRGGTVALRLVVDAVARVQVGTDRTAAELALARLDKEMVRLSAEWHAASANFSRSNSSTSTPAILGMVVAGIIAVIPFSRMTESNRQPDAASLIGSLVVAGVGIAIFVFCLKVNAESGKRYAAMRSELEAPYLKRKRELEEAIKKNRKIVADS